MKTTQPVVPPVEHSVMDTHLDARKQTILRAVCDEHIVRAEPVGSELIVSSYSLGVRSATVRNEMAELTEMGYLRQPHTSAGRVPSDRGYRFYVDRLMPRQALTQQERSSVRRLRKLLHEQVDEIIREACQVVAELTRYTSIATPPIVNESRLESIRLLVLDTRRILVVLVLESGRVEHEVVELGTSVPKGDVDYLQAVLNQAFAGRTCGELSTDVDFAAAPARLRPLLDRIAGAAREGLQPRKKDEPVVEGEVNAIREPEFQDIHRLDSLMELLHSQQAIHDMIALLDRDSTVAVVIGSETGYEKTRECSFVGAPYSIGGQFAGTIGVLGPTRMRYSQALPVVETVAGQLSRMLTSLMSG